MTPPLLLDSFAALRLVNGDRMQAASLAAIREAGQQGQAVLVSPVTAWETAELAARGKLRLLPTPHAWFTALLTLPGIALAPMPPEVLVASAELPGTPPTNPALRIVAATAREFGCRIVTRSRSLLAYAQAGHADAIPC